MKHMLRNHQISSSTPGVCMKIRFRGLFNFRIYIYISISNTVVDSMPMKSTEVGLVTLKPEAPSIEKTLQHGSWDSGFRFSLVPIQKIHKNPILEKPWIPGFRCGPFFANSKLLELPRMAETYRMITGDFSGQWSEEQRLIKVDPCGPDSADWPIFSSN